MNHIIYHKATETADCPDGIVSAAIAALALDSDFELIGDIYRKASDYEEAPDPDKYPFQPSDKLIIVDFSYPKHWLQYWESKGIEITVIDHHAAKIPMLEGFSGAILDENECGATLSWKHFFPDKPLPALLIEVRRRDIGRDGYYRGEVPHSEAINEAWAQWRYTFDDKMELVWTIARVLVEDDPAFIEKLRIEGEPEIIKRDEVVKSAATRAELKTLDEYTVPFVALTKKESRFYSIIGNAIEYLGSSGGCQSDCNSPAVRDTANNTCESFGIQTLSLAGLIGTGLFLNTKCFSDVDTTHSVTTLGVLQIFAFGGLSGFLAVAGFFWIVKRVFSRLLDLGAIIRGKGIKVAGYQESQVSIIAQERELHQKLEDLFVRSSSEISNDEEIFDTPNRKIKQKKINELICQVVSIKNDERSSSDSICIEVDLLELLSEYVQEYWSLISPGTRKAFYQLTAVFFKLVKLIQCEEILNEDLFELYERAVYRYINSVCQVSKKSDLSWHLCEIDFSLENDDGNLNTEPNITFYPGNAEDKAEFRIKDIGNEKDWIDLPKSQKKITAEKVRQHMKKRGYT